jgi:hypothetical protein
MAQWCHPKFSLSGKWRLPYPQKNWYVEKTWNDFLLDAMVHALAADAVFSIPGDEWGEAETQFYCKHLANLEAADNE